MALDKLTKIQKIGINTTTIPTLGGSENVGVVTATTFVGDGSGLSNVTGSGSGVIVRDGGSLVGTAGTINFGTNLNVSAISAGIVTVTNAVSASALTNLSDVTITSASNGQILKHNGSVFVNTAETTYSQSSVASGSNVNLRLTDSGGTNDDILITAGSNITFSSVSANGFTIAASGGGGGGGLSNVVEDTTPELGGNLNLNNKFITGSGGANVSGVVTATSFVGNITGNVTGNADTATTATNVTVSANNSTDETVFPLFVDAATGTQGAESDTGFTYNPSTGNLTATKFTGSGVALTGVVTSIVAGANITLTGGPTGIVTIASSGGGGGGGITLSDGADNRVVTASSGSAVQGEPNLTFNGSTLALTGDQTVDGRVNVTGISTFSNGIEIGDTSNVSYRVQRSLGSSDTKCGIAFNSGGSLNIFTDSSGAGTSRISISNTGDIQFGTLGSILFLLEDYVTHAGDTNTQYGFDGADSYVVKTGGSTRLAVANGGATVTGNLSVSSGIVVTGVSTFHDNIIGTATTALSVTVADESADSSCNVLFATAATGNVAPKTGTNLTFASDTGALTAGSFVKSGGSSSQFLKADGSVDSNTYLTSGSYLQNVVEDTSPQLGGNLDLNSKNITGTGEIRVVGLITATSAVKTWTLGASGSSHYTFTGDGFTSATNDPDIYLERGKRYAFLNNSGGTHPFQIRLSNGGSAYTTGVTYHIEHSSGSNSASQGYITFNVPWDAPASLYYQCTAHSSMGGNIYIRGAGGHNTNVGLTTFSSDVILNSGDMTVSHTGLAVNIFESTDNHSRFRIKSGSSSLAQLEFADQDDADAGEIRYDHGNDRMTFHVGNNAQKLRIDSDDEVHIGDSVASSGTGALNIKTSSSGTFFKFRSAVDFDSNLEGTALDSRVSDNTASKDLVVRSQNLVLWQGSNEKLRLGSEGQLGISGANYGTSGQVLSSTGSSTGVSWKTPLSVLISSTTVSSDVSSVTFTEALNGAFSDYGIYIVTINNMRLANDNRDLHVRYRTGTNGATQVASNDYLSMTNGAENADSTFSATSQWRMNYNNIGNESAGSYMRETFNAIIYFYGFEANRRLRYHGQTTYQSSDGNIRGQFINGTATDATEVTGLEFFSSTGNINLGKFSLFGVNG